MEGRHLAQPLTTIDEVKATGPTTAVFQLSKPDAEFFGFGGVGSILIVPKHIWSQIPNAAQQSDPKVLVGSCPYRLESYERSSGAYLYAASDSHFLGKPQPREPGWIPASNPFHVDVEQYGFNPAAAASLLDGASYVRNGQDVRQGPDGQPLRFSLLVTSPVSPVVDLVVSSLKALGVEVAPQALDAAAFNQRVIAGGSEISIISFGGMNTDHGEGGYLQQVYSSKTKATQHAQGYLNPMVDQLLDQQQATVDVDERKKIVAQVQRLVADDLPLLPLVYPNSYSIFRRARFDRWYYTPGGVAGTVPSAENKQLFVTGRKTGLDIRPIK